MISGTTKLVAHIGYPTEGFKAPLIYNPWFESRGIDAAVVPMGVKAGDLPSALKAIFAMSNVSAALVTMPHKLASVELLDASSDTVRASGACNAILKRPDGTLFGEMFDGEGFVRGLRRKGFELEGISALVVGAGGVGSAIAAALAGCGVASVKLCDLREGLAQQLLARLSRHFPAVAFRYGEADPSGFELVVNATPLGMKPGDPLPFDVAKLDRATFVGEVVLEPGETPLLRAARERGCQVQTGLEMLFEQIPAYLEFFGFGTTTPEELRAVSGL
ncbi:MAG: shikimate dehydrogenase [bacterium]